MQSVCQAGLFGVGEGNFVQVGMEIRKYALCTANLCNLLTVAGLADYATLGRGATAETVWPILTSCHTRRSQYRRPLARGTP